uniref:Kazal-type serine protease inhibitor domain-containing protein 1 n=1 Tax=Gadus morhua TaxID=8049 RepID=A0A8C5BNL8_GADMO
MAHVWLCVGLSLTAWVGGSLGLPPQHLGWLRLWEEGAQCGDCLPALCPPVRPGGCPAGRVRDRCDCCERCANGAGQRCDPDAAQEFYGRCGEGLVCRRKAARRGHSRANPEPACTCRDKGRVCGSDGWTYPNLCQLKEASSRSERGIRAVGAGTCRSAPRILRGPRHTSNSTGSGVVFGCEVSAYPLPSVTWKKRGSHYFLPGDHPRISVQMRGGPQRYSVSTWLQIQGLQLSDAGVYSCISQNALGETSATGKLTVLRQGELLSNKHIDYKRLLGDVLKGTVIMGSGVFSCPCGGLGKGRGHKYLAC